MIKSCSLSLIAGDWSQVYILSVGLSSPPAPALPLTAEIPSSTLYFLFHGLEQIGFSRKERAWKKRNLGHYHGEARNEVGLKVWVQRGEQKDIRLEKGAEVRGRGLQMLVKLWN